MSGPPLDLARRWRRINFARLNHILIPAKSSDRDRLRRSLWSKPLRPMFAIFGALSRDGRALSLLAIVVGVAGLDVTITQAHLLFATLAGLLLASLVARPAYPMRGCRLEARTSARVAVGEPQEIDLVVANDGPREVRWIQVEGPFLPWDGKWASHPTGIARLLPGQRALVRARATFVERGEHHLDPFEAGAQVPLGLTVGPRIASRGPRFLVVPKPARVVTTSMPLRAPSVRGTSAPNAAPGQAEIASVRPYRFGDPLKHLHARTWARTGIPHVRQYTNEHHDRVAVALCTDATTAPEARVEAAVSLVAGVAADLALHGVGIDWLVLDDTVLRIEPRQGTGAVDRALDALATLRPATRAIAWDERLAELAPTLSTLVLVTADGDPRRRRAVDAAAEHGLSCRWIEVVDETSERSAPELVGARAIVAGEAIAL